MAKFVNANCFIIAGSAFGFGLMAYKWWNTSLSENKPFSVKVYEKLIPFSQAVRPTTSSVVKETVQVCASSRVFSFLRTIAQWIGKQIGRKRPMYTPLYTRLCTLPDDVLLILQYCDEVSVQNTHGYLSNYVRQFTKTTSMKKACKRGDIKNMIWILERNGCPWGTNTFVWTTSGSNMEVLQWLKRNGYPWGAFTFTRAIRSCDSAVLKWLNRKDAHGTNIL